MKLILLLLTICLTILACKKHNSGNEVYWPCDISDDSISTVSKLEGSWQWINYACPPGPLNKADKNINVTFNSNGTYNVQENSVIITQGSWQLKSANTNLWILDLSSTSSYLKGFIFFCDNRVDFADDYEDGCSNYFKKID